MKISYKKLILLMGIFVLSTNVFAQEHVVASGGWQAVDYEVQGEWKITTEDGKYFVSLDENFATKSGPDLFVLLSEKTLGELTNSNTNSNSKQVGKLEKAGFFSNNIKGAHRFQIPADIDIEKIQTILIHCVKYSHLWAGASIKKNN